MESGVIPNYLRINLTNEQFNNSKGKIIRIICSSKLNPHPLLALTLNEDLDTLFSVIHSNILLIPFNNKHYKHFGVYSTSGLSFNFDNFLLYGSSSADLENNSKSSLALKEVPDPEPHPIEICNNGIDDNKNGLVDCEDSFNSIIIVAAFLPKVLKGIYLILFKSTVI